MIDFIRMQWLIRKAPKVAFEIRKAESRAIGGGVQYSDMPRGGGSGDKLERDVITLAEIRYAYSEILDELAAMQRELEPLVDALQDPDQRAVMRLRYLAGHSPETIADRNMVPLSRSSVYRYLRKAEDLIRLELNDT